MVDACVRTFSIFSRRSSLRLETCAKPAAGTPAPPPPGRPKSTPNPASMRRTVAPSNTVPTAGRFSASEALTRERWTLRKTALVAGSTNRMRARSRCPGL